MIQVRKTNREDAEALLQLIDALAAYEKLTPPDDAAKQRLVQDMFADRPRIESLLVEVDGVPAGYTLFFETYSSFLALPTLYLEDLFVLPEYRSRRAGSALFREMIAEAHRRGCGRMEWSVLDWNQLAIDFYDRFGARRLHEWHYYRFVREDMERVLSG
ncbi:MAG: GCN5-related N-acetyltransferase [Bryobacterales bacterium]|nr:GCN5-related N-acetyltransferase [Bryobacterales bacterium]